MILTAATLDLQKKKNMYGVQTWNGGKKKLGESGMWLNHGNINKMLYFQKLFLDFEN